MPSLADLRANPPKNRAETRMDLCLDGALIAQAGALQEQAASLTDSVQHGGISDREARIRGAQLRDESDILAPLIAAASGVLTVRASVPDAEWRRFVDANPARREGDPGRDRDQRVTRGIVSTDALLADLGRYAYAWDGDPLGSEDWAAAFAEGVAPGDLRRIAAAVVNLYEAPRDFSLRWIASPETPSGSSESASPEASASPSADSTAGNPAPSSEV